MAIFKYLRVSSTEQSIERQVEALKHIESYRTITDKATGANKDREGLTELFNVVREGDEVYILSPDRLARNTQDLLDVVNKLNGLGVTVHFVSNGWSFSADSSNGTDKLMLTILAAVAEFELVGIKERQRQGIEVAKAKGVYANRKRQTGMTYDEIAEYRNTHKLSYSKTAEALGCSQSTVAKAVASVK